MPRPIKGYTRPTEVRCQLCGGSIAVAPRGRIPDGHAECQQLHVDLRRVIHSLEHALDGKAIDQVRALRKLWTGVVVGDGNTVWNRADNPARRRKASA